MRSSLVTCLALTLLVGFGGCGEKPSDDNADTGDGDGDGDGDETSSGDGDGSAETDPDCPAGTFDCPCDNGMCEAGLTCGADDVCSLGGDPTGNPTGDPTGDPTGLPPPGNPYDPEECEAPAEIIHVELLDGSFCSAPCVDDSECPDGPPGTDSLCTISTDGVEPNHCGLLCTPGEEGCPEGASCEEIPQQPGFGLCTY